MVAEHSDAECTSTRDHSWRGISTKLPVELVGCRILAIAAAVLACATQTPSTLDAKTVTAAAATQPAGKRAYALVDATAEYFRFWDAHAGDPLTQQVEKFTEEVVAAHPELYSAELIGLGHEAPYDDALRQRLSWVLPQIAARLDDVRATHRQLGANLKNYAASFLSEFDDFRFDGRIYVMGSIDGFDGSTQMVDGRLALSVSTLWPSITRPGQIPPRFSITSSSTRITRRRSRSPALTSTVSAAWP